MKKFSLFPILFFSTFFSIAQIDSTANCISHYKNLHSNLNNVKIADLDMDGDMDIVFSNFSTNLDESTIGWFENQNGEYIAKKHIASFTSTFYGFYLGDIDDDGDDDILVSAVDDVYGTHLAHKWLWAYKNYGDGTFTNRVLIGPTTNNGAEPRNIDVGDFDNDGDQDIAIFINSVYANPEGTLLYFNDGGSTSYTRHWNGPHFNTDKYYGLFKDVNHDGNLDILHSVGSVRWLEGDGNGGFTSNQHHVLSSSYTNYFFLEYIDIDGNGWEDLLGFDMDDDHLFWAPNDSNLIANNRITIDTNINIQTYRSIDLENDGDLDVIYSVWGIKTFISPRTQGTVFLIILFQFPIYTQT